MGNFVMCLNILWGVRKHLGEAFFIVELVTKLLELYFLIKCIAKGVNIHKHWFQYLMFIISVLNRKVSVNDLIFNHQMAVSIFRTPLNFLFLNLLTKYIRFLTLASNCFFQSFVVSSLKKVLLCALPNAVEGSTTEKLFKVNNGWTGT